MSKCGCGETQNVRTYEMTDRLWSEFFSTQDASGYRNVYRPLTAKACAVCVSDWQRYAGPLVVKQ